MCGSGQFKLNFPLSQPSLSLSRLVTHSSSPAAETQALLSTMKQMHAVRSLAPFIPESGSKKGRLAAVAQDTKTERTKVKQDLDYCSWSTVTTTAAATTAHVSCTLTLRAN